VLLQVPWTVRHPLAAEPDRGAALALVERYSGQDGDIDAAVEYAAHPGNQTYEAAVSRWLAGGNTDDDLYASLFG
jgi:Mn-containing catalase